MNTMDRSRTRPTRGFATLLPMTLSAFAASVMLMAGGSSQAASDDHDAHSPAPDAAQFARGAKQWQLVCGSCHNLRSPSELSNAEWEVAMGQMRVRAGLTAAQTRDITAFLKASNVTVAMQSQPTPASIHTEAVDVTSAVSPPDVLAAGSAIYHQTCVACHGADGKGVIPGAPDFTDPTGVLNLPEEHLEGAIENGMKSPGAPIAMPPKGGNASMTKQDIHSVLVYLHHAFGKTK